MEVPANQVKSVYAAAARLKMERVVNHCARFLVYHLDPATAIEIRSLTGIQRNPELVSKVDSFLASQVQPLAFLSCGAFNRFARPFSASSGFVRPLQISTLATTPALRNLPLVQVELLATTREEIGLREANVDLLCHLILDWIRRNWDPAQLSMEQLSAKVSFGFTDRRFLMGAIVRGLAHTSSGGLSEFCRDLALCCLKRPAIEGFLLLGSQWVGG